jgi:sugar O-acyltransferase (sialic acid O-acetyltransferase NeuD family)
VTAAPIIVVGGGGLAREVAATVAAVNADVPTWELLGFLDDDPTLHGTTIAGHEVLGPLEVAHDHPDVQVVICIASPSDRLARKRVAIRLGRSSDAFATIIHPAASIGAGTEVGAGTVILAGTVTTTDVTIGEHCVLMPNVTLTHDDLLASYVICGSGVLLSGMVQVGEGTYLGAGCHVRESCWVGAWAMVGMGAVLLEDVPVGQIWVGNPARYLRSIELPVMVAS